MIGLVFEAFAWQAFAGEYGMRDEELMELLKESNLLDDFINIGVPGMLRPFSVNPLSLHTKGFMSIAFQHQFIGFLSIYRLTTRKFWLHSVT